MLASLALAACNYPVAEPTPTEPPADLAEIEAMVGATLIAEGEQTQAAADAGSGSSDQDPQPAIETATQTENPSPTETLTATPAPTATATPPSTDTPVPPTDTPQPSGTPEPTDTEVPTEEPTAGPTECSKFTNASISAKPGGINNQVTLTWNSSGGCTPIAGRIEAIYEREEKPYATYDISGNGGKLVDTPPVRCEGTFTIKYTLVLMDATGATLNAGTETQISWIC